MLRAILILDILREVANFAEIALRLAYNAVVLPGNDYLNKVDNWSWISTAFTLVVSFALLGLSRPIAQLAAKFAEPYDQSQPF